MGVVITIASGKGGVGKTTVAANLGAALASLGKHVLVADTDFGVTGTDLAMGLENRVVYNSSDILDANCMISKAMIRDERFDCLYLLPASKTRDGASVSTPKFQKLIGIFRNRFDFVILDAPSGFGDSVRRDIDCSDLMILTVTAEDSAVRVAKRLMDYAFECQGLKIELLLNRLRLDLVASGEIISPKMIQEELPVPIIGVISEDDEIMVNAGRGKYCIDIRSAACREFKCIARRLLGENVPITFKGK